MQESKNLVQVVLDIKKQFDHKKLPFFGNISISYSQVGQVLSIHFSGDVPTGFQPGEFVLVHPSYNGLGWLKPNEIGLILNGSGKNISKLRFPKSTVEVLDQISVIYLGRKSNAFADTDTDVSKYATTGYYQQQIELNESKIMNLIKKTPNPNLVSESIKNLRNRKGQIQKELNELLSEQEMEELFGGLKNVAKKAGSYLSQGIKDFNQEYVKGAPSYFKDLASKAKDAYNWNDGAEMTPKQQAQYNISNLHAEIKNITNKLVALKQKYKNITGLDFSPIAVAGAKEFRKERKLDYSGLNEGIFSSAPDQKSINTAVSYLVQKMEFAQKNETLKRELDVLQDNLNKAKMYYENSSDSSVKPHLESALKEAFYKLQHIFSNVEKTKGWVAYDMAKLYSKILKSKKEFLMFVSLFSKYKERYNNNVNENDLADTLELNDQLYTVTIITKEQKQKHPQGDPNSTGYHFSPMPKEQAEKLKNQYEGALFYNNEEIDHVFISPESTRMGQF